MRYLLIVALFLSVRGEAQLKNYIISAKKDTLNRVDLKGLKQGPWVVHVDNARGERGYEEEGYFIDNKKEGMWRKYSLEGDMIALENYRWGNLDGKSTYYTNMGDLVREESWK